MRQQRVNTVAVVEDDEVQQELMVNALKNLQVVDDVLVFPDGTSLLEHLKRAEEAHSTSVRSRAAGDHPRLPSLILLDLNLPGVNGRELLKQIKSSTLMRRIPVIVITNADAKQEAERIYDAGANAFISKPGTLDDLARFVQTISDFWLRVVQLPTIN